MGKYTPNYRHISRLERIEANDALNILASIEMQDKDISDPAEYNKMYDEEMRMGYNVMMSAFKSKNPKEKLEFTGDANGEYINVSDSGDVTFCLQYVELKLTDFCNWATKKGYKLPDELAVLSTAPIATELSQGKKCDSKTMPDQKDKNIDTVKEDTKVIENLLKMVITMAIKGYSYNPKELKSTIVAELVNDLAALGLSLSETTIRKRLKEAVELLPRKEITE